jgi:hypothetical protein
LPVLKATFPSSLIFSAIAKVSCGSGGGLGADGADGVDGGEVVVVGSVVVGGGDVVGTGVCGSMFEPDPDA